MNTLYFIHGVRTIYTIPDLFVFKTKNKAEKAKTKICDFYSDMGFDYEYELKEVDITNLNIKDDMIYCVVGLIERYETQTWVFDTKAEADAKEKELQNDPNCSVEAIFYISEINIRDGLDTMASVKEFIKEEKEFYDSLWS